MIKALYKAFTTAAIRTLNGIVLDQHRPTPIETGPAGEREPWCVTCVTRWPCKEWLELESRLAINRGDPDAEAKTKAWRERSRRKFS